MTYLAHLDPMNTEADRIADERADFERAARRINKALSASELIGNSLEARVTTHHGVSGDWPMITLVDVGDLSVHGSWSSWRDAEREFAGEVECWLNGELILVLEAR